MRITKEKKEQILELRAKGLSYGKIVKATGVSRSSVIKINKAAAPKDTTIEARIKKPCINPRLVMIYFNNEIENDAKCIVQAGLNYPQGKTIKVKKVQTSEEPLYRIA